ncbi:MAG TPA: hypothetical protein VN653_05025 [Anaerolineales bacterium]|nr:hypothetical protein [Anaerolineales bacterium]
MKKSQRFTLLLPILVIACGSLAGLNPAATATPQPTNTAEPTFTPLPSDTPTSPPTSTPDAAATKAAKATETADAALAELDKYLGEDAGIPYQEGHLLWQQSERYSLNLTGPDSGFLAIEDIQAGDFIFKADVTWEATGLLVCGGVFRSEADIEKGKQYIFSYLRLSGLPAWSIDVNRYGQYQNSVSGFRTSGAVDLGNGATNLFLIVAQDNQFTVYINRTREGRFFDNSSQLSEGVFGFFGAQDSGKGTCDFENAWIWSLDK